MYDIVCTDVFLYIYTINKEERRDGGKTKNYYVFYVLIGKKRVIFNCEKNIGERWYIEVVYPTSITFSGSSSKTTSECNLYDARLDDTRGKRLKILG